MLIKKIQEEEEENHEQLFQAINDQLFENGFEGHAFKVFI